MFSPEKRQALCIQVEIPKGPSAPNLCRKGPVLPRLVGFHHWLISHEATWRAPMTEIKYDEIILHTVPSSKLTWQWKIPIFNRAYIFNWSIFHCHVSLPQGNCFDSFWGRILLLNFTSTSRVTAGEMLGYSTIKCVEGKSGIGRNKNKSKTHESFNLPPSLLPLGFRKDLMWLSSKYSFLIFFVV